MIMNRQRYNCLNCSAPIGISPVCEYCGTRLEWLPVIKFDSVPSHTVDWAKTMHIMNGIPEAEFMDIAKGEFLKDAFKDLKSAIWTREMPRGLAPQIDGKLIQMRLSVVKRGDVTE